MRVRILIPAAMMMGGYLAACSKPATENSQKIGPNAAAGARHIELVEAPPPDAPVVSALEAGQALKPTLVRRAVRTKGNPKPALAPTKTGDVAAAVPVLALSRTAIARTDGPQLLALAPAPVAVAPAPAAPVFGEGRSWRSGGAVSQEQPEVHDRGPAIIIRGGSGGANDPCDLHDRRGRGAGIAINSLAPSLAGTALAGGRGPRLGGIGVGMPSGVRRGGIR